MLEKVDIHLQREQNMGTRYMKVLVQLAPVILHRIENRVIGYFKKSGVKQWMTQKPLKSEANTSEPSLKPPSSTFLSARSRVRATSICQSKTEVHCCIHSRFNDFPVVCWVFFKFCMRKLQKTTDRPLGCFFFFFK